MELKTYFAQDAAGNIISSAIVNVFLQGTTTLATGLTRADGTPLENPFAADGAGRIQFRAPDGYYDVQVSAGPGIIQTLTIQCVDYSGAKADADRAEAAADRADVSAEQAQNALNSITGINTNFEQNSREQWRRSLAEAGITLVSGSFEEGATVNSKTDAVWHISVGQCYTWDGAFPKAVPADSTPTSTGGVGEGAWVSVGDASLRSDLASEEGSSSIGSSSGATAQDYFSVADLNTVTALISSFLPEQIKVVRTSGYYDIFGKRDIWVRSSETTTPSQTPLQLNKLAVSDAAGSVWYLDISSGFIYFDSIGAKGTGLATDDDWPYLELALKNAEQGTNRVVRGNGTKYYFSKPIMMKSGRHLEFMGKFGIHITYGGLFLSETDAPAAATPIGIGYTSTFSDKQAPIVVVHGSGKFANYWSIKNCFIKSSSGTSTYGIYCPFANNFELESVWIVGGMAGFDGRNIYAYSFKACYFSPPDGVMGTVGFNVTPIENGRGSGTTGVFERVGISNYHFSWIMSEMNYTTWISCYSEGRLTRNAISLTRCNGMVFNAYGIENLTAVGGDGRLLNAVDTQVTVNGLQASFNINLSGATAVSVKGNSQATINDMFIAGVGTAYSPLVTDNTSKVRMFGFKHTGVTPGPNSIGVQTVTYGDPGRTECMAVPGNWNGGFIRIGAVRLWDDGTGLRIKRGADPSSVNDGTSL